eukprot:10692133-Alexandrium_andersonii.AAC.1
MALVAIGSPVWAFRRARAWRTSSERACETDSAVAKRKRIGSMQVEVCAAQGIKRLRTSALRGKTSRTTQHNSS